MRRSMRYASRTDPNHPLITSALTAHGLKYRELQWPCDLLVKTPSGLVLAEIKPDDKPVKLTQAQQELIDDGFGLIVLRTPFDVANLLKRSL